MATSGTYSFTMTRDDIINAALRLTTRFSADDVIPPGDIANCAQSLNILCKEMVTEGLPLWCVKDYAIPMVAGQATYNLSTATGMTLPVRILDAYLRYATGNDIGLSLTSRYDYNTLGQKTSAGNPNQYWYDPQLGAGTVTVFNVPFDSTSTMHVVLQRQIMDLNLSTDNPDFPQEAYRLLKWCLADEIALEYSTPPRVIAEIEKKANMYRNKFFAFEQEYGSITFSPTIRSSR